MKHQANWPRFVIAFAAILTIDLGVSTLARAEAQGYRGKYAVKTSFKDGPRVVDGKVTTRGAKLRIDYADKSLGILILDLAQKTGFVLFEDAKRYQEVDLEKMGSPLPICPGKAAPACLQDAGFVKAGGELIDGQKAERWEATKAKDAEQRPLQLTVWILPGMPDLPYVRLRTKDAGGVVNVHEITDLSKVEAPGELFQLPSGYTKPGDPAGAPAAAAAAKE